MITNTIPVLFAAIRYTSILPMIFEINAVAILMKSIMATIRKMTIQYIDMTTPRSSSMLNSVRQHRLHHKVKECHIGMESRCIAKEKNMFSLLTWQHRKGIIYCVHGFFSIKKCCKKRSEPLFPEEIH
jgi:hypothetical protein